MQIPGSKAKMMQVAACAVVALAVGFGFSAPAEAKKLVKICAVLPTSGPNAATGIGMMNSMDLAINRINKSGKMGDIELELVKLDDNSQASVGVNAVLKASSDKDVLACSAHWNSPVALATRDIFHRNGLANLIPAAINWKITAEQSGDEIFRISPPDVWQLEMGARFPVAAAGKKSFFLIDDNTQYGKSLVEATDKFATQAGAKKIGGDSIAVGEKDFTAVLTKVRGMKPDFVFFGGVTTESALIRQQMVRLGVDTFFYTGSGTMSPTFIDIAGPAADGAYAYFYGLPYLQYPGGKMFIDAYNQAKYNHPYETYGIWAYATMEVLSDAIKRAEAKGKLNRRGIIDELKSGSFDTVLGPASFPRPGDIKERVMAYYQVKGKQWIMTHISKPDGTIEKVANPTPWELPWSR